MRDFRKDLSGLFAAVASISIAVIVSSAGPVALAGTGRGAIEGEVVRASDGMPVACARVILAGTGMGTMTIADGSFRIGDVPAGVYDVRAEHAGYEAEEKKGVEVGAGTTPHLVFELAEMPAGDPGHPADGGPGVMDSGMKEAELFQATGAARLSVGTSARMIRPPYPRPPYPPYNTEEYARIEENRFRDVAVSPLSTFSIDVDGASYSNVRRFLMAGELPPADAVRVEEMINYFDYDYGEPDGGAPFSTYLEYSACPWDTRHHLVHIGLQGASLSREQRAPSNLVFLIDVSGSMGSPEKLPLLRDAFKLLVNQLGEDDEVSIVVYAGSAGIVLPPTGVRCRREIIEAIDRLHAGGSTAGGEGIRLAYRTASDNFIEGGNNRVILATDGDFNVGISSTGELVRFIEGKRDEGIFLTVLGFGMGNYKDHRLEQLADRGNGNHAYIDDIMEARKVFVNEITGTLYTIAKDVKIQVEFNPARVSSYRLVGYENRALAAEDFTDDRKDAGEMGAGHTVTALYEIVPASGGSEEGEGLRYQDVTIDRKGERPDEVLMVRVRYKEPAGETGIELVDYIRGEPVAFERASDDMRFSAAVAMFGMILRDSPHRGDADLGKVIETARGARGEDPLQYRAGFITLAERALTITELAAGRGGGRPDDKE